MNKIELPKRRKLSCEIAGVADWPKGRHTSVATVPNHWAADINVGTQLMARGSEAEALKYYYQGSAINPNEFISNMAIGDHEQSLGHSQEATSRYQQALSDYNISPN